MSGKPRRTRVTDQKASPPVLADFRYDALGRRIEKVADGTTFRYYLDGQRIVEETEGTGSPTVERLRQPLSLHRPPVGRASRS